MRILAIDFEGTHREPRRGCPVQIGVAAMEDGEILDSDEWLIRPPLHWRSGRPIREVDAYSLRVSGLSLERIEAEGFDSRTSCSKLGEFVTRNRALSWPVVAFSFTYDAECYGQMLFDGGVYDRYAGEFTAYPEVLGPKWICAYRMARLMLSGKLARYDLDSVADYFGLCRTGLLHGAREDCALAWRVYFSHCRLSLAAKTL